MPTGRYDRLDALRGAAIAWMTAYHFGFDLNFFGWIRQDFYRDPVWTWQRTAIVSLFLFCAGLSQAVAHAQGQRWPRFWRRWAQIAGCALLVTAGSWLMFPRSYIFFGVLHGIAVMLVVVRLTAGWGRWLWPAGAIAIGLALAAPVAHASWPALGFLDRPPFHWLGLVGRKPITEDYVPVFPWLGVMWWGMAAGQWLLANRPQVLQGALAPQAGALAWMGRWSLSWYMLHQPVMIGVLAAVTAVLR
ncbi:heparan-alpha-glucosaminide N-acetyltransferase [Ramlibacter sp.]|uniref:heparan-alpha-glucosaminide N-acetyltransferase n=1 Tax=Ramlibacter sp. TaxID=1917967 RepID=UPI002FC70470